MAELPASLLKLLEGTPEAAQAGKEAVKKIIPAPLNLNERIWQNYASKMNPDELWDSEAIWGSARRMVEDSQTYTKPDKTPWKEHEAFAYLMNDMLRRKGLNGYVNPEMAQQYMSGELTKQALKNASLGGGAVAGVAGFSPDQAKADETPTGRLYVSPWNPVSTEPAKPGVTSGTDQWKPVSTKPLAATSPPTAQPQGVGGWIVKAIEPLTSYFPTQRRMAGEAVQRMGEGVSEIAGGKPFSGAFKAGTGALGYVTSPIEAGLHTIVGKPLEENVGIPHQYSEFAAGLAIPGYGLSRTQAGQQAVQAARQAGTVVEKLVSPETVDADARAGSALIREWTGGAARETAQTAAAIEPSWKKVNSMPATDQLDFISYVEGRSGRFAGLQMRDPALQNLADTLRTEFNKRMAKIQAMPKFAQMTFIQDYFPHFWKEPGAAANAQPVQSATGISRAGSGASTKARTIPTYTDGLALGFTPLITNPLEATLRYVTSMDRFIAQQEIFETAKNAGQIKFIQPRVMGASGHPQSFKVPDGWMALKGRGASTPFGGQAYAPEGFARVYNNWIDARGAGEIDPAFGTAYDAARRASNAITGLELSLSGYHFLTVSKAAMDNSMANAIRLLRAGKPVESIKQFAKTLGAPVTYARSGKQVKDVYLGLSQGSQQLQNTVEQLTKAGGRAVGRGHAPEYEFSKGGSYYTAFRRGALRLQLAADRAQAQTTLGGGVVGRSLGEARFAAKQIGRIMDTVAAPLFEQYIPVVKNGAFRENLATWLKVHPNATAAEQENAARQIWDSIDDRFGEMVSENLFMNQFIKQLGMLGLRSWSWTVGQDIRMLGGAARDIVRAPFKTVRGTGPQDERWTQKMDMAIAMPIVYGTLAMIYQGLKTGQPPRDIHDLMAPRTGGTDAKTGEPQRLLLPGPEKDIYGVAIHGTGELWNKKSKLVDLATQAATNKDYRGDPVFSGAENAPPWLQQFWEYMQQSLPISVQSLMKGQKVGSNLNKIEQLLGVREAPSYLTDKQAYDDLMERMGESAERKKLRHQERERGLYEE